MADQAAAAPLSTIPKTWPGGFGAYKHSKQAIRQVLGNIVILYVAALGVSFIIGILTGNSEGIVNILGQLASNVISFLLGIIILVLMLAGAQDNKMSISEAWAKTTPVIVRYFLLSILLGLIALGSFLLFIVPFFIIMPRLFMAYYFAIDQNLGVMESINASWNQTKGHVGKIWGTIGVSFVFVLLAITIIGIPFAIYFSIMYSAVYAVLYYYIVANQKAPEVVPSQTAAPVVQ